MFFNYVIVGGYLSCHREVKTSMKYSLCNIVMLRGEISHQSCPLPPNLQLPSTGGLNPKP